MNFEIFINAKLTAQEKKPDLEVAKSERNPRVPKMF